MEVKLYVDDYGNYSLAVTELRRHPTFVITTLAVRILTSGIIPIILLIFFYAKVICFDLLCYPVEGATNNYFFFATHCAVVCIDYWTFETILYDFEIIIWNSFKIQSLYNLDAKQSDKISVSF